MKKLTTIAAGAFAGSLLVVGLSAGSASAKIGIPIQIGGTSGSFINAQNNVNLKLLEDGDLAKVTITGNGVTIGGAGVLVFPTVSGL